ITLTCRRRTTSPSLHDALPIWVSAVDQNPDRQIEVLGQCHKTFTDTISGKSRAKRYALTELMDYIRDGDTVRVASMDRLGRDTRDRKSTRLNSSHVSISYAVFC